MKGFGAILLVLPGIAASTGGALFAQAQSGNLHGTVHDDQGASLPGVTVVLNGVGAPATQFSDGQGQFRFIGLYPGSYQLEANLDGFSPVVYSELVVNVNRNTTVELTMNAAITETITIDTESPLLDQRQIASGATISRVELEKIPTVRDPWAILRTTAGVQSDTVNVGGGESGYQGNSVGKGDDGTNNTFALDGVEISSFAGAAGYSASFFDFDAFEEMQVTTGGSDASLRTGGIGMNLVTKRGTNEWRGTARYLAADQSWQSSSNADSAKFGAAGPWNDGNAQAAVKQGNRIVRVEDYGAELGGPLVKDRFWVWGGYGRNSINLLTFFDYPDATELETWNLKLNAQFSERDSATLFFSDSQKRKENFNASPTNPPETTWKQRDLANDPDLFAFWSRRPTVSKIEASRIFASDLFLTLSYAESDGSIELIPNGGTSPDVRNASLDENFVWHNTIVYLSQADPQDQLKADGSAFFATGDISHELKFGANWREATASSRSIWPGFGIDFNFYTAYGYAHNVVAIARESLIRYSGTYANGYVQDTLTAGNLTANVGLRYDRQTARQLPSEIRAVQGFEDLLPAVSIPGGDLGFAWETISPRLGLTYALGVEKKTLVRASYARFAEQLGGDSVWPANPGYPGAYVYAYYDDRNGDSSAQPDEVLFPYLWTNGTYNPLEPSQPVESYLTDPGLDAPVNDELLLGVEHALRPELVLGLSATWRHETGIFEKERLVFEGDAFSAENIGQPGRVHTASDYVVQRVLTGTLPDGSTYSVPVYGLRPGLSTRGGTLLTNGERERDYLGISLVASKRLSNRWMLRGNFTWSDWRWRVPTAELDGDLTPEPSGGGDGDRMVRCTGNLISNACISASWSYNLSALYQVKPEKPWGFDVAMALNGRQGYANPYQAFVNADDQGLSGRRVGVTRRPDDFRNGDVHVLDLRVEKQWKRDRFGLTLGVDLFNALNSGQVLQRRIELETDSSDHVEKVISPRIFRLGARLSFN